jgi:hypothetical protein
MIDLQSVPEDYRVMVARWVLERAKRYQPNLILTPEMAGVIQDVLVGVAVDIAVPDSEDMTVTYAAAIIRDLMEQ